MNSVHHDGSGRTRSGLPMNTRLSWTAEWVVGVLIAVVLVGFVLIDVGISTPAPIRALKPANGRAGVGAVVAEAGAATTAPTSIAPLERAGTTTAVPPTTLVASTTTTVDTSPPPTPPADAAVEPVGTVAPADPAPVAAPIVGADEGRVTASVSPSPAVTTPPAPPPQPPAATAPPAPPAPAVTAPPAPPPPAAPPVVTTPVPAPAPAPPPPGGNGGNGDDDDDEDDDDDD